MNKRVEFSGTRIETFNKVSLMQYLRQSIKKKDGIMAIAMF